MAESGELDRRPTTTVDVSWESGFRFTSSDSYGHTVTVDAPVNEGDNFDGFMPGELLLTSLAGCSGIDVVNILTKQRQQVTGLEIRVKGTQEPDPPWTWTEIELMYTVRGKGLSDSAVSRAIDLSENKYCSVGSSLGGRTRITSTYDIVEEPPA
jgi:putative redox protein